MKLTRARLVELREQGLTFAQIAEKEGLSSSWARELGRRYLPAEAMKRQRWSYKEETETCKSRIVELSNGGMRSREIAGEVHCPRYYVLQVLRQVEHEKYAEGRRRCVKCEFLEEERNPVGEDGLCLWCRLQGMGVNLLEWHESGAAREYACSGLLAGLIVLVDWLVAWRGRGGSAWPRVANEARVIQRMMDEGTIEGREGCRRR